MAEYLCRVGASVPTGLEIKACEECKEVLGRDVESSRGRLSIKLKSLEELTKVSRRIFRIECSALQHILSSGRQFEISGQLLGGGGRVS